MGEDRAAAWKFEEIPTGQQQAYFCEACAGGLDHPGAALAVRARWTSYFPGQDHLGVQFACDAHKHFVVEPPSAATEAATAILWGKV